MNHMLHPAKPKQKDGQPELHFLTFSILCKIYLPKHLIDQLNLLFSSSLKEKISFPSFSQQVTHLLEISPQLLQVWQLISERQTHPNFIQYELVSEIVNTFETRNIPRFILFSFFEIVTRAVQQPFSKTDLLCQILKLHAGTGGKIQASELMSAALELYQQCPRRNYFQQNSNEKCSKFKSTDIWASIEPVAAQPETVHPLSPPEKKDTQSQHEQVGPSYERMIAPQVDGAAMFFVNCTTHSCPRGSEGESTSIPTESELFLRQMRYFMFTQFENLVVADNRLFAALSLGQERRILFRTALRQMYGDSWPEFALALRGSPPEQAVAVISNRCKNSLPALVESKHSAAERLELFLSHLPIFDLSSYYKFSCFDKETKFRFYGVEMLTGALLKHISEVHSKSLSWFLKRVMSLFIPRKIGDEHLMLLIPDVVANALYFYAKVDEAARNFFDFQKSEELMPEALIKQAGYEIELKYLHPKQSSCSDFLKFFAESCNLNTKDTTFQILIDKAEKKFGEKSKSLFQMIMYLTRVTACADRLLFDSLWPQTEILGRAFGRTSGPNARERLRARLPLYKLKAHQVIFQPLVLVEYGSNLTEMKFSPL